VKGRIVKSKALEWSERITKGIAVAPYNS
jgi:hypothetical protein